MYFHDNKSNTNIDDEFEKENIFSKIIKLLIKYKIIIFVVTAIIVILLMIFLFVNKKVTNYLILNGEEEVTIYQNSDYIEQGFKAYNSKNKDLSSEVIIKSTLNNNVIGEYEITYTLDDIVLIRKVKVISKPTSYTYIYLNTISGSENVYLKLNEKYVEPGYQVFGGVGEDLTKNVKVTGNVDTSKKGEYILVYSVTNSSGITVSATRKVVVMDSEINLSTNPSSYTNKDVNITANIIDPYFDYMILPDGTKVSSSTHTYNVKENGTYNFTVYNKKGMSKTQSIEVKNIDRTSPNGTCELNQDDKGSYINITATDKSGIKSYIYNNKNYSNNKISLSSYVDSAKITIYDNAGNSKEITCKITSAVMIDSITSDGVIVNIKANKINTTIAGYYFSYTSQRPDKNTGGYIATSKDKLDVVRLPGTTYVWVEDKYGKVSSYKTITIKNDVFVSTNGNDYDIINQKLSKYLQNKGWSIEELNKLIARSVRAAGLYSKEAAVTAAVSLQSVLAQKYKIKLPYNRINGKSWSFGAESYWGEYKPKVDDKGTLYENLGLDCSGFVAWAYQNAGYNIYIHEKRWPAFWDWKRLKFSKDNAEVGDYLVNSGHIKLIIAKTNDRFITAEAKGKNWGMVIHYHKYSDANGYSVVSADTLMNMYQKIDKNDYPTGI